jgi:hypothetical protein
LCMQKSSPIIAHSHCPTHNTLKQHTILPNHIPLKSSLYVPPVPVLTLQIKSPVPQSRAVTYQTQFPSCASCKFCSYPYSSPVFVLRMGTLVILISFCHLILQSFPLLGDGTETITPPDAMVVRLLKDLLMSERGAEDEG